MTLHPFWSALQFLTRIPVPKGLSFTEEEQGHSLLWYPAVGLVIGIILVLLRMIFMESDPNVQAALLLLIWVGITGALHLDGLADSADAWLGGHGDRERTMDIMKDRVCGPAAVVIVTLVLIAKYASLAALAQSFPMWPVILVVPMLARAGVLALLLTTPYVRPDGIAAVHAEHLPRKTALIALGISVLVTLLFLGFRGIWVLLVVTAVAVFLRWLMLQRIGGTTGDTAGALIELLEVAALLALAL